MVGTPCKNVVMIDLVVFKLNGFEFFGRLCLKVPFGPKGAGSYLAGMAVAIPILNVDGRRHTNNFSKNIKNVKNINFKV